MHVLLPPAVNERRRRGHRPNARRRGPGPPRARHRKSRCAGPVGQTGGQSRSGRRSWPGASVSSSYVGSGSSRTRLLFFGIIIARLSFIRTRRQSTDGMKNETSISVKPFSGTFSRDKQCHRLGIRGCECGTSGSGQRSSVLVGRRCVDEDAVVWTRVAWKEAVGGSGGGGKGKEK